MNLVATTGSFFIASAKVFLFAMLLTACSPKEGDALITKTPGQDTLADAVAPLPVNTAWLGQWTAVSNNYMGMTGDMAIGISEISWAKLGRVDYEVLYTGDNYSFITLEQETLCGTYLKLGPVREADGYVDMEVTFYSELPTALYAESTNTFMSRSEWMADIENSCSSGMFSRQ
jgi:hypothetical protein